MTAEKSTAQLALECFDELQAQKQRIWDMANDLFQVLQEAQAALVRSAPNEDAVSALIETTLDKYTKK
jgi:hypothetical protein